MSFTILTRRSSFEIRVLQEWSSKEILLFGAQGFFSDSYYSTWLDCSAVLDNSSLPKAACNWVERMLVGRTKEGQAFLAPVWTFMGLAEQSAFHLFNYSQSGHKEEGCAFIIEWAGEKPEWGPVFPHSEIMPKVTTRSWNELNGIFH